MIEDSNFISHLKRIELVLKPSRHSKKTGIHQIPQQGRSLEFTEYREYRAGDELKDLDWKLYARSDRFYIKQRDNHAPAKTLILLDNSPSMGFESQKATVSKFRGGLLLAFGLGYILFHQGDAFSFQSLSSKSNPIKPRSSKKSFRYLIKQLRELDESGPLGSNRIKLPSLRPQSIDHVFIISDFLLPVENCLDWILWMKKIARNCVFFRLIDPEESDPNQQISDIQNIENLKEYRCMVPKEWNIYQNNYREHEKILQKECRLQHIDLKNLVTEKPVHEVIHKALWELKVKNKARI